MSRPLVRRLLLAAALALLAFAVAPAGAEQSGRAGVVVSLDGSVSPRYLPRHHPVPVSLTLAGTIRASDGSGLPRLARIELAFGARGGLDTTGLPRCPRARLLNSTTRQALARCPGALVGRGTITTEVPLAPEEPLLARARVLAFNGSTGCPHSGRSGTENAALSRSTAIASPGRLWPSRSRTQGVSAERASSRNLTLSARLAKRDPLFRQGERTSLPGRDPQAADRGHRDAPCHRRPAVWVHAYSASPAVSFVLPFTLRRLSAGAYGVLLRAPVQRALGRWPRLRSFRVTLGRRYRARGERRSYLSARCPLPPRFSIGILPLARATYHFAPAPTLTTTILRGCRVRR